MLDIKLFRENKELIIEGLKRKNFKDLSIVDKVIEYDELSRKFRTQIEESNALINKSSSEIPKLIGKDEERVNILKNRARELKEEIVSIEKLENNANYNLKLYLEQIPNLPHISVPIGTKAEDNEIVKVLLKTFTEEERKPHWELLKDYNLASFELGNKLTGNGFPVFIGQGVRLQRSLIQYFLDYNTNSGYTEYSVPHLVNEETAYGTGQLPDKEGQMYFCDKDKLYLIPTAEVPLTNIYRDEIVELPIKMTGYTPCFRRESGSYGKEVRALNRVHQFDKVEIVQLAHPDRSYDVLDEMVAHVEGLLRSLELPYRILRLCGGDMSFASALTYDFEVYSKAQDMWLEVSSVSNFESFQSNRMKIRFKDVKKNRLVHTLNGSALALPRIIACLLENNQTPEGIKLPKVLHSYFGNEYIK